MKDKAYPFFLTTIGVFLIIISPNMFSQGMFMDGLLYATISQNLANGLGDFWHLHLTNTLFSNFFEHPPLAFGLQSILFSIFGNSFLIERSYSFFTFVVTGIILIQIWKMIINDSSRETAWLPLFLWLAIPLISWSITNNMLENTMMIFTSLSVLCILKSIEKNQYLYLILSGLSIFCAFLTKGFIGLFPYSFMFWIFLFKKQIGFKRFVFDSIIITISSLLPLIFLYLITPESIESLLTYINKQVLGSISNVQTVDSRFYILKRLGYELIPNGLIVLISVILTKKKKFTNPYITTSFVFFALGLSGVLPIIVSMKQSGFYMLATFPFFSIAIALLILPRVEFLIHKINTKNIYYRVFKYLSICLFACSIFLLFFYTNHYGRDKSKIEDVYTVSDIVPSNSIIAIEASMRADWSLHGYFSRYSGISLDYTTHPVSEFLLIRKESDYSVPSNYTLIPIKLNLFELYSTH